MKKRSISLMVFLMTALVSCTLYMDEENSDNALRTNDGYLDAETITLPNGQGTVTYKYNKQTIAITDEVEEYVVRNDGDSIVWFSTGIPDDLLPMEGEMMTSSFRDKFPNGFCHRCTGRTEVNGLYRCTFTPCGLFDAFDEFKAHVDLENAKVEPAEGVRLLTAEEYANLMNEENYEEDNSDEEEDEPGTLATRPFWKVSKTSARAPIVKEFPAVDVGFTESLQASVGHDLYDVYCNASCNLKVGTRMSFDIDKSKGYFMVGFAPYGFLSTSYEIKASAGVNFKLPIDIPILGVGGDLVVVGGKIGLSCTPYFNVRHYVNGKISFNYYFNGEMTYTQIGNDDEGVFKVGGTTRKESGKPVFSAKFEDESAGDLVLNIESGFDFHLGLGFKLFETGVEVSAGAKVYATLDQTLEKDKLLSAEAFRKKNANFPTYYKFYVTQGASLLSLGGYETKETKPIKAKTLKIPFYPVWESGKAYCKYLNPLTFTFEGKLKELGLVGALMSYTPKAYVYLGDVSLGSAFLDEVVDLKWKEGDLKEFSAEVRSDKLEINTKYTVQYVMDTGKGFLLPLAECPMEAIVPNIYISNLNVVQTLTADNASAEELANPSIVAVNPTTMQKGWVFNGKVYKYRYKVNVGLKLDGIDNIYKWGIHMNDNYSNSGQFETSSTRYEKPTVRMTWYSNSSNVMLNFYPYAYLIDQNGNRIKDRNTYKSQSVAVQYNSYLDRPFGYQSWELDGGDAQFEK